MMIYQDKAITAMLPEQPAAKGHVQVRVAQQRLEELSPKECSHLLSFMSFAANALFEQTGAQGTNIVITDVDGMKAEVLARTENDGLSLQWQPQRMAQEEMDSIAARIKDRCDYISQQKPSVAPPQVVPVKEHVAPAEKPKETKEQVRNYLLRQLDRIP